MKLALLSIFLALPICAQDAKVIVLDSSESKAASEAYAKLQAAQKEYDAIKSAISKRYDPGWGSITFSQDFKAIVPVAPNNISGGSWFGNGCITLNPTNAIAPSFDHKSTLEYVR